MTRVSVCVATYNAGRFLAAQLNSVLDQLGPDDEVVVSDDGSTDGTAEALRTWGDRRVRVLDGPPVRSPTRNLERALVQARGEIVFLCDQDDVWLPGRVREAVALHEGGADVVVVDCRLVDATGRVLVPSVFQRWPSRPGLLWNLYRNRFVGCCMSVRRSFLAVALPIPRSAPMHDSWIGLLAEAAGTTQFHPVPLVDYRQHAGNVSPAGRPSPNSRATQVGQRVRLLGGVVARVVSRQLLGLRPPGVPPRI